MSKSRIEAEQQVPEWADPEVPEEALDRAGGVAAEPDPWRRTAGAGFAAAAVGTSDATAQPAAVRRTVGQILSWSIWSATTTCTAGTATTRSTTSASWRSAVRSTAWTGWRSPSTATSGTPTRARRPRTPEILKARAENPRMLIFQGLEWYIPAAEHGTVLVAPGAEQGRPAPAVRARVRRQADRLDRAPPTGHRRQRGARRQGAPVAGGAEAGRVRRRRPGARQPPDAPRASTPRTRCADWRDAAAGSDRHGGRARRAGRRRPGWVAYRGCHQRAARRVRERAARRTAGPATRRTPIGRTAASTGRPRPSAGCGTRCSPRAGCSRSPPTRDNHRTIWDTWKDGELPAGQNFDNLGWKPSPTDSGVPQPGSDFWPGQFSRTHVGVTRYGYLEVMAASAGRPGLGGPRAAWWTASTYDSHRSGSPQRGVTLGGRLRVPGASGWSCGSP